MLSAHFKIKNTIMFKQNDIKIPQIMENQIVDEWAPLLKSARLINESIESNPEKLALISKIAHIQQTDGPINEGMTQLNENSTFDNSGIPTLGGIPGVGNPSFGSTLGSPSNFVNGTPGSGDKWLSPFKISLQIAAKTVGFDIVNTIPITAPTGMIYYLDYIYSDGDINGTGNDAPKMFKIATPSAFTATKGDKFVATAATVTAGAAATGNAAKLTYVGKTRVSGYSIFTLDGMGTATANAVTETSTLKIADVFDGAATLMKAETGNSANANTLAVTAITATADYVVGLEDHVYGYSNGEGGLDSVTYDGSFVDGTSLYEGARRGVAEKDRWQEMTTRITNKNIETRSFKVAVTMTQEQLQDMKRQHNWDLISKSESALVNEASQNINKNILARAFALGWAHHIKASAAEGVNLNLALDPSYSSGSATATYVKNDGTTEAMTIPAYQTYATSSASFENLETIQRRIVSRIFACSDLIHSRGRRGAATGIVTNAQIASALRNVSGYSATPFANSLSNSNLYPMGKIDGLTLFVDPNMKYTDTRVLVFRKGNDDDPGLKFLPYLLGESIQTITSNTMSPKIALSSRFALTEYGQNPELQYLTFYVKLPTGGIV